MTNKEFRKKTKKMLAIVTAASMMSSTFVQAADVMTQDYAADETVVVSEEPVVVTDEPTVVSEKPVVEDEPATDEPVVEGEPAAEEPVVEDEPATDEPVVEDEPAAEEPVVEDEPATDEPVVEDEPAADEPAVEDESTVDEPAVEDEPTVDEPAVEDESTVDEPAVEDEPTVDEPAVEDEPTAEEPTVEDEPAVEEPAVDEPTVEEQPTAEDEPAADEPVDTLSSPVYDDWYYEDGYWYYYDYYGNKVTNTHMDYYDENDGNWHCRYLDESGRMLVSGIYSDYMGSFYYFDENGYEVSGIVEFNGNTYYFDREMYHDIFITVEDCFYHFSESGPADVIMDVSVDDWFTIDGETYYLKDGDYVRDEIVEIGGERYYFDYDGRLLKNQTREYYDYTLDKLCYFRLADDGHFITGWYTDEYGDRYYYNESGVYTEGPIEIEGNTYLIAYNGRLYINDEFGIYNDEKEIYDYYRTDEEGHLITEWYTDKWDQVYYYGEDGVLQTGLVVVDGEYYYFNKNMYCDFYIIHEGTFYYFGAEGKAEVIQDASQDGWITVNDSTKYYLKNGDLVIEEFIRIDGYLYYFDWKGRLYVDEYFGIYDEELDDWCDYRADKDGRIITGWYTDGWNYYYYDENGREVTGLVEIGGEYYYFDNSMYRDYSTIIDDYFYYFGENGNAEVIHDISTDGWIITADKNWYFKDGELVKERIEEIEGKLYYFDYEGKIYKDIYFGLYDEESDRVYHYQATEDGSLYTGWYVDEYDNTYYYFENGRQAEGVVEIESEYYYFNYNMFRDFCIVDNGYFYYFGHEGNAEVIRDASVDGWVQIGEQEAYLKEGELASNEIVEIDGKLYYFNDSHFLRKNEEFEIYNEETDSWNYYRSDSDGCVIVGWYDDSEDKYYYTENGRIQGIFEIDGVLYFFNPEMLRNHMTIKDGYCYWFGSTGALENKIEAADGWMNFNGATYYIKNSDILRNEFLELDGNVYYFNYNGIRVENTEISIFFDEEDTYYYYYRFDKDGCMIKGWYTTNDGSLYYYGDDGRALEGMKTVDGVVYYFDDDGEALSDYTFFESGCIYYFGSDSKLEREVTLDSDGWIELGDSWYYAKDGNLVTGWLTLGTTKYYFNYIGEMYENTRVGIWHDEEDDEYLYRFADGGAMVTGWYKKGSRWEWYDANGRAGSGIVDVNGTLYCFDEGDMLTNISRNKNGIFYYFGNDGKLEKKYDLSKDGWIEMPDGWYYAQSGSIIKDNWLTLGTKKYYFDYWGRMYEDTVEWIYDHEDGMDYVYRFDASGAVVTGWYKYEGDWYWYDLNGRAVSGFHEVDGILYHFSSGRMQTDYTAYKDGILYYFGDNGTVAEQFDIGKEGWIKTPNGWYYAKSGDILRNEWLTSGGKKYYFTSNGSMYADTITWIYDDEVEEDLRYAFDESGAMITGWYEDDDDWYWFETDGRGASGIKEVNGITYYFIDGRMYTDRSVSMDGILYYFGEDGSLEKKVEISKDGWVQMPNGWYYVQSGKLLKNKWLTLGSVKYYFDSTGHMLANEEAEIYNDDDDFDYYYRFDASGAVITGWYKDKYGYWYYYDSEGRAKAGVQNVNGTLYCFTYEGEMQTDEIIEYNGVLYYFGMDGIVENQVELNTDGWYKFEGDWYYAKNKQLIDSQWMTIDGHKYYFLSGGSMASNGAWNIYNEETDRNHAYRFDENGYLIKGLYVDAYGYMYYYGEDGTSEEGLAEVDGVLYYHYSQGDIATAGSRVINGVLYTSNAAGVCSPVVKDGWFQNLYYVSGGKPVSGWKLIDNKWYYFDKYSYMKVTSWLSTGDKEYYFNNQGIMQTGWIKTNEDTWLYANADGSLCDGWCTITGIKYYFEDCRMLTGIHEIDGKCYKFSSGGAFIGELSGVGDGWYSHADEWYYIINGKPLSGQRKEIDGTVYYFNYDGVMTRNYEIDGFYIGANGAALKNQWLYVRGNFWKYYGADCKEVSGWQMIGGVWYYFDEDYGYMQTSDRIIDGKLERFNINGVWAGTTATLTPGWNFINGYYYYYVNGSFVNSEMRTIDGNKYYFDSTGKMAYNSVKWYDGSYYCFDKSGKLVIGWNENNTCYGGADGKVYTGLHTIDGKQYYFDENGYIYWESVVSEDGKKLYDITNGVVNKVISATGTGWVITSEGRKFYQNKGFFVRNKYQINGKIYWFDQYDGALLYNGLDPYWGYSDANGVFYQNGWCENYYFIEGESVIGPQIIDGKYYFFETHYGDIYQDILGSQAGVYFADGAYYYYDGEGQRTAVTLSEGWNKFGSYYYYVRNGDLVRYDTVVEGNSCYEFDYYGKMYANTLRQMYTDEGGKYVYYDASGKTVTGWKKLGYTWYYFDQNGHAVTGIQTINGTIYTFNRYGELLD